MFALQGKGTSRVEQRSDGAETNILRKDDRGVEENGGPANDRVHEGEGQDVGYMKGGRKRRTRRVILGNTTVLDDHETAPGQGWRASTCTTNGLEIGERAGIATGVTRFT